MNKKELEDLKNRLVRKPRLVWDTLSKAEKEAVFEFAEGYKAFLDRAKTEREAVQVIEEVAQKEGFKNIKKEETGRKFYRINKNKSIALAVLGEKPLIQGLNIIAAHIDSPRLDLKQNPLYEEVDLVFFKTHYYGGVKKYQWLARPLAIHGRIVKKDGSELDICIGESEDDPVFTIADLLPHLARKVQADKKMSEAIEGEKLNILVGSMPIGDDETKERFKLGVLKYLNEVYGLVEEDLFSAEIEVVPAGKARDIGWDRSLIGAYGQDDRVCAYATLRAICELERPGRTALALFIDKEEIGSDGSTGIKSRFTDSFLSELFEVKGEKGDERSLRDCLLSSMALSADVNGALDPDYQEVHEKRNAARIGYGVCITKFTGSGGKYGSNDANAEYLGLIRNLFNSHNVIWQAGELGKVDEGGGGTIAKFLAIYGMEILDCGTALLSMHSPFEIASKADIYMTYRGYKVFFKNL
nr:aminopeptidase [Desulfobacterales bacterium]